MNIYRISQDANGGYDTYDSAVVIAKDEETAKRIHPSDIWARGGFYDEKKGEFWNHYATSAETYLFENEYGAWTNDLSKIRVQFIGTTNLNPENPVICASFNAG